MAADPTDDPSVADEDLLCRRLNPKWIVPDSTVGERVSSQAFQNHPGTNNMSVFVKKDHEDPMAEVPPSHGLTEFAAGVPRRFDQKIVRDTEDGQHRSHAHVVGNKSKALKRELARVTTAAGWQMAPPLEH